MNYFISNLEDVDTSKFIRRGDVSPEIKERVSTILNNVKSSRLKAILEYTEMFDQVKLTESQVKVSTQEMEGAYARITDTQLTVIRDSINSINSFHLKQKESIKDIVSTSEEGSTTLRWLPVLRTGIYVPAGKAPLPSSLLMSSIPAKIAGVKEIFICTPPKKDGNIDPSILVAANECGIKEIYKIGGAQAIAAMAYGCELFKPVDIISGPGNVYTAYAKQLVSIEGIVKIDAVAGPSEVLIIADETADSELIASDILAQAEHGVNSSAICITDSKKFAELVNVSLKMQLLNFADRGTITESLKKFGGIFIAKNLNDAINFTNNYAPEHVEIFTDKAEELATKITNAGAVFIRTGEVFGDYGFTGSNHILPTNSTARFASGVSVYTFMKYQFVESLTKKAQTKLGKKVAEFAGMEKLEAHKASAERRSK